MATVVITYLQDPQAIAAAVGVTDEYQYKCKPAEGGWVLEVDGVDQVALETAAGHW